MIDRPVRTACNAILDAVLPACCPACLRAAGPGLCPSCADDCRAIAHPCPRCAAPRADAAANCQACDGKGLPFITGCMVPWHYAGAIRTLIHRAKGGAQSAAIRSLGQAWPNDWLRDTSVDACCIIPPNRDRLRGPHLATHLAATLARSAALPRRELLHWQRPTWAQHQLGERDRQRNVRGSLACRSRPPERVLLVDDILTTGATCSEAARALRQAGARQVLVTCLARSPHQGDPSTH